ncbi:MAG: response regulator [Alphaproteobacteria bacterium]|nr:response regulator [Alphaproteobacteria bacterium]
MTYRLNTVKILLVEDMHPMLLLTRSILDIFGFKNVITAKDGEEAFQKFCYEKPDLVITDWIMDSMNGLELIEKIRTDSASPDKYVPIILMTGYSNKGRVEAARDCGMTEFLAKPFKARDLYTRIVQIVEKPRQFVKNENFFGPDRRRRKDDDYAGPVRREDDRTS